MRGIVLAGGMGTRLRPMTRVTNKHLLPVYDRPMIFYPIQQLVHAGLKDILLVTGGEHAGDFLKLLGNGRDFGLRRIHYAYQEGAGGIAEALGLAEEFADGDPVAVILGDNVFQDPLSLEVDAFASQLRARGSGARILLKSVTDPERFGVAVTEGDAVVRIIEKPPVPPSDLAVTGCYLFDSSVFDRIRGLSRSARGEMEITDVNNDYVRAGLMEFSHLSGWWSDAGTVGSLLRATTLVSQDRENPALRLPGELD